MNPIAMVRRRQAPSIGRTRGRVAEPRSAHASGLRWAVLGLALLAGGCMVQETRPLPKLAAVQAMSEIPQQELLDVGVRLFDPGIPPGAEEDLEGAAKKGLYPDIRKAEARFMPNVLRQTLEGSGQWGAVRVIPPSVLAMDVMVDGRIVQSTGYHLALDVTVSDATGRKWFSKRYEQDADTASYREGPGRSRDPYQNVYANIANDMLAYRKTLKADELVAIPRVTQLRFAQDLAPAAFKDYLAKDAKAKVGRPEYKVVRLPAQGDPIVDRVEKIRERDAGMIDTVSEHYASFAEKIDEPYDAWRRSTYDEIEAEQRLSRQATTRKLLGAAAVLGGILAPGGGCSNYNCARIEDAARAAAVAGGVMAVMSGFQKGKEAQMHTDALKEITGSFQTEAAPMVVDVEGRTLKLTGTAEAQYAEWRKLLHDLYEEETGLVDQPSGAPDARGADAKAGTRQTTGAKGAAPNAPSAPSAPAVGAAAPTVNASAPAANAPTPQTTAIVVPPAKDRT